MTPERIKDIQEAGEPNADTDTVLASDTDSTGKALTWGELRFLLDTAAQAGKTCEWREDAEGCFHQHGMLYGQLMKFCPDCGGRVVIRDGRT